MGSRGEKYQAKGGEWAKSSNEDCGTSLDFHKKHEYGRCSECERCTTQWQNLNPESTCGPHEFYF